MEFETIMREITGGLTGDSEDDVNYLAEQVEIYKDHEMSNEIIKGISSIMWEILPVDLNEEYDKLSENDYKELDIAIEDVLSQINKDNPEKALSIIGEIIKPYKDWFVEDESLEYLFFQNVFEMVLYLEIVKPSKFNKIIPYDFGFLYFLYGNLLLELERFKEAECVLEKSIRINPVDTQRLFELSEICKIQKDMDKYFEITNKCLKYSYINEDLAHSYRNLAYYFLEKENFDLASTLLYFSMYIFPDSKLAFSEIEYISQITGKQIEEPSIDDIEKILNENNIQFGPNHELLNIAVNLAIDSEENKNHETALLCYEILYELTFDDKFKEKIDELAEKLK